VLALCMLVHNLRPEVAKKLIRLLAALRQPACLALHTARVVCRRVA